MEREKLICQGLLTNSTFESDFKIEEMRGSLDLRASQGIDRKSHEIRQSFCSRGSVSTLRTTTSLRGSFGSLTSDLPSESLEKSDFPDSSSNETYSKFLAFNPRLTLKDFNRRGLPRVANPETTLSTPQPQTLTNDKYKYVGFLNSCGKRQGFGICYYKNGDKYSGYWQEDKKSGWGKYETKSSGKTFQGEFRENNIDGYVEYISKYGVVHQGLMRNLKFVNNEPMVIHHPLYELTGVMNFNATIAKLVGLAKITYRNGISYEGEIVEAYETGWGITKHPDRTILKGVKSEGKMNGYCEVYSANGEKFFGHFINGKRNGMAISYSNGIYSLGNYLEDIKDGGFVSCCRGEAKFELFLLGFLTKTVEKKEDIINYINLCYPEFRWLYQANNKGLYEMISK